MNRTESDIAAEHPAADSGRRDTEERLYPLMEEFLTIQGEGVHAGRAAWFIRLAGCDVSCWWCDVKESWDVDRHPEVPLPEMVRRAVSSGAPIAVITGGEPLLHDLEPLTTALRRAGLKTHLETSGSSPLTGDFDWITLSPKRFRKPLEEIYELADELKVIVLTKKDLEWAEENAAKCPPNTELLLQPEWETPGAADLIVDYVKRNPRWRVSLQTHKFIGQP